MEIYSIGLANSPRSSASMMAIARDKLLSAATFRAFHDWTRGTGTRREPDEFLNFWGHKRKKAAPKSGFFVWPRVQIMQLVYGLERNSLNASASARSL
jgi:hypothetical protein